jgi:hypothetical protein
MSLSKSKKIFWIVVFSAVIIGAITSIIIYNT